VPYVRPERMFGRTTNNFLSNLGWARKAIFSFSYSPIDLLILIGFFTMLGAFAAIGVQVAARLLWPDSIPPGMATVIVLLLFFSGLQMLAISVLGCYLAHIYDEVKRRPPYVVESVLNAPARAEPCAPREYPRRAG
jgi:polyisoprenyl-phosphate glycosyltransferase